MQLQSIDRFVTDRSVSSVPLPLARSKTPASESHAIQRFFDALPLHLVIHQMDVLPQHLHHITRLVLSDASHVYLQVSPPANAPLLRHERQYLETEARMLYLLQDFGLPLAQVLYYDPTPSTLGAPFLLTTGLYGTSLAEAWPFISSTNRTYIECQLAAYSAKIMCITSSMFGSVSRVEAGQGHRSWPQAFHTMVADVLRDGEDAFVNLPYTTIREAMDKAQSALTGVQHASLVIPGFGKRENVLVDDRPGGDMVVVGLLDFKGAFWGDSDMVTGRASGSVKGLM